MLRIKESFIFNDFDVGNGVDGMESQVRKR